MTDKRIRYTRVKPHQQTRKNVVLEAASLYASPVLGSRLVFPRLFNRAAESLLRGRRSAAIPVSLARWYFGEKLLIHVDPARLTRRISDFVREPKGPRWVGSYFLDSADWSRALSQIASTPVHKEMSQIVEAGLDYRATEAFAALNRIASEGRPTQRNGVVLKGRDEIEAYFRYCVGLITSVREHGIARQQFGSFNNPAGAADRRVRSMALDWTERDVGVAINADGELIRHLGGKHRTAIAQALHLPSMPVEVRMVHVNWLRRQVKQSGMPAHEALAWGLDRRKTAAETAGERTGGNHPRQRRRSTPGFA